MPYNTVGEPTSLITILEAIREFNTQYRVIREEDLGAVAAPKVNKDWTIQAVTSKIKGLIGKTAEQIVCKTKFPAAFGKGVNWAQDRLEITQGMVDELNQMSVDRGERSPEDYREAFVAGFASMCPVKMTEAQIRKMWEGGTTFGPTAREEKADNERDVCEDAPGMAAGNGGIAGIGIGPQGEPGVMRRSRLNREASTRRTWREAVSVVKEGRQLVPKAPYLDAPQSINGSLESESDTNIVVIPLGRERVLGKRINIEKYILSGRDVTLYGGGTLSIRDFRPGSTLFYRYDNLRKRGSLKVPARTVPWDGAEADAPVARDRAPQLDFPNAAVRGTGDRGITGESVGDPGVDDMAAGSEAWKTSPYWQNADTSFSETEDGLRTLGWEGSILPKKEGVLVAKSPASRMSAFIQEVPDTEGERFVIRIYQGNQQMKQLPHVWMDDVVTVLDRELR